MSSLALTILKEPTSLWFKDVGGKRKHMICEVQLVGSIPKGRTFDVKTSIYYESGKPLADEWQWILHLMDDEESSPMVLSEQNRTLKVRFRIERVSTSFMNQRFSVRIEAVPKGNKRGFNADELTVFTNAIESKAKPKRTGSRRRCRKKRAAIELFDETDGPVETRKRPRKGDALSGSDEQKLRTYLQQFEVLQRKFEHLEQRLKTAVGVLERSTNLLQQQQRRTDSPMLPTLSRPSLSRLNSWDNSNFAISLPCFSRSASASSQFVSPESSPEYGPTSTVISPREVKMIPKIKARASSEEYGKSLGLTKSDVPVNFSGLF